MALKFAGAFQEPVLRRRKTRCPLVNGPNEPGRWLDGMHREQQLSFRRWGQKWKIYLTASHAMCKISASAPSPASTIQTLSPESLMSFLKRSPSCANSPMVKRVGVSGAGVYPDPARLLGAWLSDTLIHSDDHSIVVSRLDFKTISDDVATGEVAKPIFEQLDVFFGFIRVKFGRKVTIRKQRQHLFCKSKICLAHVDHGQDSQI